MAARSAPPTAASSSSWSPRTGRARRSASRIAAHLRIQARSSMPAPPRPVTTEASVPQRAAISVEAAVVPPTLRSPSTTRSVPESASSSAMRIPSRTACSASSAVSASSTSIRPLPRRTRSRTTASGSSSGSQSRPAVHDPYGHGEAPGQHGHGARAVQHRADQLVGGARGPAGDLKLGHPVIPGEQHDAWPLDRLDGHRLLGGRQPFPQLVEAAEGADGNSEPLPAFLGIAPYAPVGALDQVGEVVQIHGGLPRGVVTGWAGTRRGLLCGTVPGTRSRTPGAHPPRSAPQHQGPPRHHQQHLLALVRERGVQPAQFVAEATPGRRRRDDAG